MNLTRLRKSDFVIGLYVVLALLISACATGQVALPTNTAVKYNVKSLGEFELAVNDYANKNNNNILVVFDIDDTLLVSTSFFGGDTWFRWQDGDAIDHKDGGVENIVPADEIKCMYQKLGVFYELAQQKPTESGTASVVSRLQATFKVMALTSRSPGYRFGTERELDRANIDFSKTHLLSPIQALAYDFDDGSRTARVSYENGVAMTTGLNKGLVLQDLLTKLGKSYSAIFFIDDGKSNVTKMEAAWRNQKSFVSIYHYIGVDKTISDSDMQQSRDAITTMDAFVKIAFPDRHAVLSTPACK